MDATPSYGSDKQGLVWAYHFAPDQPARELDSAKVATWLATPDCERGEGFLWLHYSLSNAAATRVLRDTLQLPDAFVETLYEASASTRLEQEAEALVAVLHDVVFDFGYDASSVSSVSLCITPRLMVSARLRPLRSLDELRATVKAGERYPSSAVLLARLLQEQADVLLDIVRKSAARVDGIEDRILANRISMSRSELGNLRRMLVRLQRLMAPEPAALFRLLNRPPRWIREADLQELRNAAEEFAATVTDSATLTERVKLLQEELAALVNEQTNRTLFVLTVVTVIALPINLVAGLFGMNVGGMPLAEDGHGFLVVAGGLTVVTAMLAWFAFGRRRD